MVQATPRRSVFQPGRCRWSITYVTSATFGDTIGRPIAYAYLPASVGEGDVVEIEYFGDPIKATVPREPLHDPEMGRLRG
jgi:dimethylglycine oxidase